MATTATTACWTTTAPGPLASEMASEMERERLRAMLAALEAESAKLAEALDRLAHEFEPDPRPYARRFCTACSQRADSPVHRTAAWVRRRHGFGAT
jgi:hypothetical protein